MREGKFIFSFSLTKVPMKTETKHCIKAACYAIVLMLHNDGALTIVKFLPK